MDNAERLRRATAQLAERDAASRECLAAKRAFADAKLPPGISVRDTPQFKSAAAAVRKLSALPDRATLERRIQRLSTT